MPLSKKNYEDMADVLGNPKLKSKGQIINALATYLKQDNPSFNRDKFVKAIAINNYTRSNGKYRMVKIGGRIIEVN